MTDEIFKGQCLRHEVNERRLDSVEASLSCVSDLKKIIYSLQTTIELHGDKLKRHRKDIDDGKREYDSHIEYKDRAVKENNDWKSAIEGRIGALELEIHKKVSDVSHEVKAHVDKKFARVGIGIVLILCSAIVNIVINLK